MVVVNGRTQGGKRGRMTNREWLNSLSDKDFASWLCNSFYDENLSQIFGTPTYTGLDTVKLSYSHSLLGLKKWLAEEHNGTSNDNNM